MKPNEKKHQKDINISTRELSLVISCIPNLSGLCSLCFSFDFLIPSSVYFVNKQLCSLAEYAEYDTALSFRRKEASNSPDVVPSRKSHFENDESVFC